MPTLLEKKTMDLTPGGLRVVERDNDTEAITVEYHDGSRVRVRNVAEDHEDRDRYSVVVGADNPLPRFYVRAPERPGKEWSVDALGHAADAACAIADADGIFSA